MTALLRQLLRARLFDEVLTENAMYIADHFHTSFGQEAVAVAIAQHRSPQDRFLVNYRNHAHLIANGSDPTRLYGEIFARDIAPQRGRAGSFHLSDPDRGFLHTSALVGGPVPLAAGAALAAKTRGSGGVVFTNFGEGTLGEGVVHECLNIAQLWRLPLLFVCESTEDVVDGQANALQSARRLLDIPQAHAVESSFVDGTRPRKVDAEVERVVDQVRSHSRPHFLQVQIPTRSSSHFELTRMVAHLTPGTSPVTAPHDMADPIAVEIECLLGEGACLEMIMDMLGEIRREMLAAARSALTAPEAAHDIGLADVWAAN